MLKIKKIKCTNTMIFANQEIIEIKCSETEARPNTRTVATETSHTEQHELIIATKQLTLLH